MASGTSFPETIVPRAAPLPSRPRWRWFRRQFSLATLLLFTLAVASGINLWLSWQPWAPVRDIGSYVSNVSFSKDGSTCLLSGEELIEINTRSGAPTGKSGAKSAYWNFVSPTGDRGVAFIHESNKPPRLEIHDTRTGALEQTLDCPVFYHDSHFSADGERLFLAASRWWVCVYRRHQNEPEGILKGLDVTKEPDADETDPPRPPKVLTAEEEQQIRDCVRAVNDATTLQAQSAAADKLEAIPHGSTRMDVELSPFADLAVSRLVSEGAVKTFTWDLTTGRRIGELSGLPGDENATFGFSEDSRYLGATDLAHGKVIVWELSSGRVCSSWKVSDTPLENCDLKLSAGGRLAITDANPGPGGIQIWECTTGRLIKELQPGGFGFQALSPDGERIVCDAGGDDVNQLVLYDTASGAELCRLPRPSGPCGLSVKYAPDGRSMAVIASNPGGNQTRFFSRHHPESALGILALPGSWVLMGIGLLLGWRVVRALRR